MGATATTTRPPVAVGWLGRAGLVARGVVYAIVGVLALKLALGDGGKTTSQQGALKTVAQQPFGKFLRVALAFVVGGYAIWRLTRAALGHGREESDSGFDRVAGLVSGIAYGALCVTAIAILAGAGIGMWFARYWAVLGFEAILLLNIIVMFGLLLRASTVKGLLIALAVIVPSSYLFYKLIRAMARIQMPARTAATTRS